MQLSRRYTTMLPPGVWAKARADIGTIPPTIEAVRIYGLGGDEILMEWSLKIAGDQNGGGTCGVSLLPNCKMECEMSAGTVSSHTPRFFKASTRLFF